MAERTRLVQTEVAILEHEIGLWCSRCNLLSGHHMVVAVAFGARAHVQQRDYCDECGSGRHVVRG